MPSFLACLGLLLSVCTLSGRVPSRPPSALRPSRSVLAAYCPLTSPSRETGPRTCPKAKGLSKSARLKIRKGVCFQTDSWRVTYRWKALEELNAKERMEAYFILLWDHKFARLSRPANFQSAIVAQSSSLFRFNSPVKLDTLCCWM